MATRPSLCQLPLELVFHVGTFLKPRDLRALRSTSRSFRDTFTPAAFRTLLIRPKRCGFRKRIAPLRASHTSTGCPDAQALLHVAQYVRIVRVELGDSTVCQASIVDDLCSLPASPALERLEVVLTASPNVHIGALYTFSALVAQVSTCRANLPFETIAIMDLSRPDVQMGGTKSAFEFRLAPSVESTPHIAPPKWVLLCPPQLTSLYLSRVAVCASGMRGLYHNIPDLEEIRLHDCAINLEVGPSPPPAWHFLWNAAKEVGQSLRSVDVSSCTYLGSPLPDHTPAAHLDVLMETDSQSLSGLREHLGSR